MTGTLSKELELSVDDGSKIHKIPVTIWITPNDKDRGKEYDDRMDRAARFSGISELQGMYIYRNNRLIDFPGKDSQTRSAHDMSKMGSPFPPHLDHVFQLDPSKREIQLPRELFDAMTKISRTSYMWHPDDIKSSNHRARARERQGGKDKSRLSGWQQTE